MSMQNRPQGRFCRLQQNRPSMYECVRGPIDRSNCRVKRTHTSGGLPQNSANVSHCTSSVVFYVYFNCLLFVVGFVMSAQNITADVTTTAGSYSFDSFVANLHIFTI